MFRKLKAGSAAAFRRRLSCCRANNTGVFRRACTNKPWHRCISNIRCRFARPEQDATFHGRTDDFTLRCIIVIWSALLRAVVQSMGCNHRRWTENTALPVRLRQWPPIASPRSDGCSRTGLICWPGTRLVAGESRDRPAACPRGRTREFPRIDRHDPPRHACRSGAAGSRERAHLFRRLHTFFGNKLRWIRSALLARYNRYGTIYGFDRDCAVPVEHLLNYHDPVPSPTGTMVPKPYSGDSQCSQHGKCPNGREPLGTARPRQKVFTRCPQDTSTWPCRHTGQNPCGNILMPASMRRSVETVTRSRLTEVALTIIDLRRRAKQNLEGLNVEIIQSDATEYLCSETAHLILSRSIYTAMMRPRGKSLATFAAAPLARRHDGPI